ncbi:uroporphyrinogen-III synthase [Tropicibacter naphthalenivorans]|uniref:Uroporphyrinogen-III synthase n=1 Tax=Tropicibacter naphthalenivorans TaxID=441103 RepID=A0A0P1GDG3_9RHOB|nr:uroporphyrinogen-III synthase [Tropicibacter naphthalenivorans]CUH79498.1 uroporphyrinogen-III synthase [Tropicibacter naphthalenivorans]SMC73169.1 uroporphyrinogen-III synthase [Tropicibacter naphthalenivorans]
MTNRLPVLLLTRPEASSRRVVQALQAQGCQFRPVISPLIGITVTGPLHDMTDTRGVIFTSANGVQAYVRLGGPVDLPAYTVGKATALAATEAGMRARSADGNAEDLIAWLTDIRPDAPLLHLRGTHSRGDVAGRLTAAGIPTRTAIVYDQPELPPTPEAQEAFGGNIPIVAPVYSPRTGLLLSNMSIKAPLLVAAMSEAVVKAVSGLHITELKVAARPESSALLPLVAQLLDVAGQYARREV